MAAWAASHLMSSSEVESALALAETKRDMVVVVVVYAQVVLFPVGAGSWSCII